MTGGSATWVALLRGIGPATHAKMSMRTLREACIAEGFGNVRTYIASGNLLFDTRFGESWIRATLGDILDRHGLDNPVFLRRPRDLERVVATDPFPDASVERPDHLLVTFFDEAVAERCSHALAGHDGPERIHVDGRELYVDYAKGVGRSRLSGARIERLVERPGTARNWNTINRLLVLATQA